MQGYGTWPATSFVPLMGWQGATGGLLTAPHWVPADPDVQLFTRLCIPVRHRGALLGFMWLIDKDRTLSAEEISDATPTATEIGYQLR